MNALLTLGIIVYSIICVLLILIIIIQGGKAEGLFSSAQANVLGSQRGNALSKATTFLSTIFIVGALLISVAISTQKTAFENVVNTPANNTANTAQQQTASPLTAPTNAAPTMENTNTVSN
ncbi:preprotein translocase subunit SecG [Brachyspira hampsonii]|uniref:Protein-export membrane protein SecG n=1 Tax=Brachyspira hampsonii 30446 TaxID=1289135 RepID=A0A2U4FPE1_9SPIR|nr:preprotein translocase subunit SecG [Brachyspira hampsonii]EKV57003.1 preprotein translocase subunit SecG [Brachyspira hampsonii 30446]MBW5389713.1 preprotein translocase subunit SecG [Brachyspira hampsonii]MBW5393600.1 preprotein translocase subunit SecG [Brachyspira hampsonii]OEJ20158.1 preprotein translocase subunit SecG [Brachyspira hampsonii]